MKSKISRNPGSGTPPSGNRQLLIFISTALRTSSIFLRFAPESDGQTGNYRSKDENGRSGVVGKRSPASALFDLSSFTHTAPDCCCSHVPALLPTQHPCL